MCNKKIIIIGVVGGSGSGKTLLSKTIIQNLKGIDSKRVKILSEDHYYRDNSHLHISESNLLNFDHPNAFEHSLLKEHLKLLISGATIKIPIYDYSTHSRIPGKFLTINGRITVLIIEGIMLFSDKELRELMDIKLFIDAPMDISFIRRLARDRKRRGRKIDSIISQYLETVRPMFLQFVEPSKYYADIIVPHGGKNKIAIDIIRSKVKDLLNNYS